MQRLNAVVGGLGRIAERSNLAQQHHPVGRMVVYHQDQAALRLGVPGRWCLAATSHQQVQRPLLGGAGRTGQRLGVAVFERDQQRQAGPPSRRAVDRHGATHQLRQPPGNHQAQSGATETAAGIGRGLHERLEQAADLVRRHSDPGVLHDHAQIVDAVVPTGQFDHDLDLTALGEFDCVAQEVVQDLSQPQRIEQQQGANPGRHDELDRQVLARGHPRMQAAGAGDHLLHRSRDQVQFETVGFDPGKVQDVVNDPQQGATGFPRHCKRGALRGVEAAEPEQFEHPQHSAHRRADLVAHGGQEFGFRAVGGFGFFARKRQLGRAAADPILEFGVEFAQRVLVTLAFGDVVAHHHDARHFAAFVAERNLVLLDPGFQAQVVYQPLDLAQARCAGPDDFPVGGQVGRCHLARIHIGNRFALDLADAAAHASRAPFVDSQDGVVDVIEPDAGRHQVEQHAQFGALLTQFAVDARDADFRLLQVVDVGKGTDPLQDDPGVVAQGHRAHQPPAVASVGAAHPHFMVVGSGRAALPGLLGRYCVLRMDRLLPTPTEAVGATHSAVVAPLLIEVDRLALRCGHVDDLRHRRRQRLELGKVLLQRQFRALAVGDVAGAADDEVDATVRRERRGEHMFVEAADSGGAVVG